MYRLKRKIRELSHRSEFLGNCYSFANRCKVGMLSFLPDEVYAKLYYKENTGEKLNLENPITYNEKLWWLKLNNRDPLLTKCSDKYKVREYVKECGLEHILTELYGVYDSADDVDFEKLPDKAFLKTNHGSGTNILFDRNKPFDIRAFRRKFNRALKQNYFYQSREWNYKNIEPKIVAEEFLKDNNGPLVDYKFMCFDGKPRLVYVILDAADVDGTNNPRSRGNVYDLDFNLMDLKFSREGFEPSLVRKPNNFEEMIRYAETLSQPFPHCRVDLYNIQGKIYFGEITFYQAGGRGLVRPREWNKQLGRWIDLNSNRIMRRG